MLLKDYNIMKFCIMYIGFLNHHLFNIIYLSSMLNLIFLHSNFIYFPNAESESILIKHIWFFVFISQDAESFINLPSVIF
jgi:hypothetical protein